MKTIKVNLKERAYPIVIGNNLFSSIGKRLKSLKIGDDAIIISNAKIKKLYGIKLKKSLVKSGFSVNFELIPDSEKSKSQFQAFNLINKIAKLDVKKRFFIIALGGGVIGDLAGFVAAVYKRGINYVQVPTTLLGQVDSAIGGKVAIDLNTGKNLVGAFYQPKIVISDVNILTSLSKKQVKSGLSEVIKYAIIKDRSLFDYLNSNSKQILKLNKTMLEFLVRKCSAIKANIVQADEKETKGIRTILNYGHTIGHAIESAGGYKKYNHGEAIAIGMICAADISCKLGMLNLSSYNKIKNLISKYGLPTSIRGVRLNKILEAQTRDKKFINKKNRFVLPKKIGTVIVRENIPLGIIKKAIAERMK